MNLDIVTEVDHFPSPGETIMADRTRRNLGGKGANQAVAAVLAGAAVEMVAMVGTDAAGDALRAGLGSAGVGTSYLQGTEAAATGTAYICVAAADNTIVVDPGANWQWDVPSEPRRRVVADAALVLMQLEVPDDVVAWATQTALGRVVLNAAPARPVDGAILRRCDPLVVNQRELERLSDHDVDDVASVVAAHQTLLGRGARSVVTTLGPHGAVYSDAAASAHQQAPSVVARDTTGAGDAFVGTLAARLAQGDTLASAAAWAVAAGSLSVQRSGTHDAYPSAQQIGQAVADLSPARKVTGEEPREEVAR